MTEHHTPTLKHTNKNHGDGHHGDEHHGKEHGHSKPTHGHHKPAHTHTKVPCTTPPPPPPPPPCPSPAHTPPPPPTGTVICPNHGTPNHSHLCYVKPPTAHHHHHHHKPPVKHHHKPPVTHHHKPPAPAPKTVVVVVKHLPATPAQLHTVAQVVAAPPSALPPQLASTGVMPETSLCIALAMLGAGGVALWKQTPLARVITTATRAVRRR